MPLTRLAQPVGVDITGLTNALAGIGQERKDRKREDENTELTTKAIGGDQQAFSRLFARNPQSAALLEDIVHNRKLDQAAQIAQQAENSSRDAAFLRSISDDATQVQHINRMAREAAVAGDTRRAEELLNLGQTPYDDRNLELLQDVVDSKDALSILNGLTPKKTKPVALSQGQQLVDPNSGELIAENEDENLALQREKFITEQEKKNNPTNKEVFDEAQKLRKEFISATSSFAEQNNAFQRIQSSADDPSAAGDLALIFGFMKLLDPGSTVREGEFATVESAGGVDARVRSQYNKLISGEKLAEGQRSDFLDRSARLFEGAKRQNDRRVDEYTRLANEFGINPDLVITNRITADEVKGSPKGKRKVTSSSGIEFEVTE